VFAVQQTVATGSRQREQTWPWNAIQSFHQTSGTCGGWQGRTLKDTFRRFRRKVAKVKADLGTKSHQRGR